MFGPHSVDNPAEHESLIRAWRSGRIVMELGKLVAVRRRRTVGSVSIAGVWWQAKFRRPVGDVCYLDYHQPLGMKGVLTLDFVISGDAASLQTCIGARHVLESIAEIRGALLIVTHVSNASISDRFMIRAGWQRHLANDSGRHWVRRFYDGYPACQLHRYLKVRA